MVDQVKRGYDGSGRQARAADNRRAVVRAARDLLLAHGYAATTVARVAAAAGVSPELVYKAVGGRAALLAAVLDDAIGGDDAPVALADRAEVAALRDLPDAAGVLTGYAAVAAGVHGRTAALLLLARQAAGTDEAAAAVVAKADRERLAGMGGLARHLRSLGGVREDLDDDAVRDVLWTCTSVELWDLLVLRRGWSADRWADFVVRTAVGTLLTAGGAPAAPTPSGRA